MKICLVSNSNSVFLNTNHYRLAALRTLGHETVFFNVRRYILPGWARALWPPLELLEDERINSQLTVLCAREKFGLCLLVGGHTIIPDTVRKIRAAGIPVVLWTSDIPYPEHWGHIKAAASLYDRVFCAGTEAMDVFRAAGRQDVVWLPFACDPACHAPQALTTEDLVRYGQDIVFVGSYYPHRQKVLEALVDEDVRIWGPLWDRLPPGSSLRGKAVAGGVGVARWARIYSAARIAVVVHYQDGRVPCYQASPKLFEAMACGAFVMCDDQPDARALFNDGEHLVFFRDGKDLQQKARYYLAHPEERRRIAAAGRREVLAQHTYVQRMQRILDGVA